MPRSMCVGKISRDELLVASIDVPPSHNNLVTAAPTRR
ncbi:hypothetical protein R2A130_3597 [Ahrensia sp. R2A130]|nr:hypothetical protein R2A130_3597 [Ahrensia sp. R2A130]